MIPKPGTYRALFIEGLELLRTQTVNDEKIEAIDYYLGLLNNQDFKFGRLEVLPNPHTHTDFFTS